MIDLTDLRELVRDVNFNVHGVPATVTRPYPDDTPIETSVIWLQPITNDVPVGVDFQRREPERVLGIRLDEVPTVPRGSVILAPERVGSVVSRWRVDALASLDADHGRYVVVPYPAVE